MKVYSKSSRFIAMILVVSFLMTSLLTFSVFADVTVADTSTATVAIGETATINVANASGTEQTTVLVYLGTPDDENIIFINQKAATDGAAEFKFKVPATAAAGTYTVLAGSEGTTTAGTASLVVTEAGEQPPVTTPTITSISIAEDAKVEYTVGDDFVAPTVTATYSDGVTKTVEAEFSGYDMAVANTYTVTATYEGVTATYEITVVEAAAPVTLVSISVSDAKTAYNVGDEFVAPTVIATYSDDSTKTVDTATFEGFDSSAAAEAQTITVTYTEGTITATTTYDVVITAVEPPIAEDWAVTATFDDDATLNFASNAFDSRWTGQTSEDSMYYGWTNDSGLNGSKALTMQYQRTGGWGGVQEGVIPADVDKAKTAYISFYARVIPADDVTELSFNMNGGDAQCNFTATTAWQYFEYDISDKDITGVEKFQWTVNTKGKGTLVIDNLAFSNYAIEAISPLMTGITIADDTKTEYAVGDDFDAPSVYATYSDGTSTEVAGATAKGFDSSVNGTNTITVTYQGFVTTYDVTIGTGVAEPVANENVRNGNYAVEVTVDSAYTMKGLNSVTLEPGVEYIVTGWAKGNGSVLARMLKEDGWGDSYGDLDFPSGSEWKQKSMSFTADENATKMRVCIITNHYGGKGTKYLDDLFVAKASEPTVNLLSNPGFEEEGKWEYSSDIVRINSEVAMTANLSGIVVADAKTEYSVNDEFAAPAVTAIYFDGTTETVEATFSGYDMATVGKQTVKVAYNNAETRYSINVAEAPAPVVLESITVSDAKTVYTVGDNFEAPTVTAAYSDGTTKLVWEAVFEGYDLSAIGEQTVTVSYTEGEKTVTTTYTINVVGVVPAIKALESIAVDEDAKTVYTLGDEFVAPTVTATYTDDTTAVVDTAVFTGYDLSATGTQTVTVSYTEGEKTVTTTYTINVVGVVPAIKVLDSITVSEIQKQYTLDDEFIAPTVTAVYTDSTTKDVSAEATFTGYDLSAIGEQTVTVSYTEGEKTVTTTYDILVVAIAPAIKVLEKISFSSDPFVAIKVYYDLNDELVKPTIIAHYDDGSTEDVTDEAEFTGYDMSVVGEQDVTVTYKDKTLTYSIEVMSPIKPVSITVLDAAGDVAGKTEYILGEEFEAPTVIATFSDGTTKEVSASFTYKMDAVGTYTVSVGYIEGTTVVNTSYEITIKAAEEPVVPSVEVLKVYLDLDFTDAVNATAEDGTEDPWTMITTNKATGNKINVKFDGSNVGNKYNVYDDNGNKYIATKGRKTQIAYEFKSEEAVADNENLVYVEAKIKRISPTNDDPVDMVVTDSTGKSIFRLVYKQNVAPSLVADATYSTVTYPNDGEWTYIRAIINFADSTFELYQGASLDSLTPMVEGTTSFGFENSAAADVMKITNIGIGNRKGSLGFDDIKMYTVAPPAKEVESITIAEDAKIAYFVGDEFVAPTVTAKYTDSMYADEAVAAEFTGYDLTQAGTQTVTATYGGKTATYDITVTAVELESIAVAADAKKDYYVGDEFVAPVVTAKYNNGKTEEVEAKFDGFDSSAAAEAQTITVTYGDKTATYDITVTEVYITSIAVAADAKTEYTVGDEFVAPVVTGTYNNGTTAEVEVKFTGYDMSVAGTQTVTATYDNGVVVMTDTYEITVAEPAPTYVAEVLVTENLDEENGFVYVTSFVLDDGRNGFDIVKVGDVDLAWSAERGCYIGIIAAENYDADNKALLNVSILPASATRPSITYGDNTDDRRINNSDLAQFKNYLELGKAMTVKLAADLNQDGRLDATDLAILKDFIELDKAIIEPIK